MGVMVGDGGMMVGEWGLVAMGIDSGVRRVVIA